MLAHSGGAAFVATLGIRWFEAYFDVPRVASLQLLLDSSERILDLNDLIRFLAQLCSKNSVLLVEH